MNKKICVTSKHSLGCTFVDWSIHFLSGQSKYYNVSLDQWIDLTHDPITKLNAHGHLKNHPVGADEFKREIEKFDSLPSDAIYSTYPINLMPGTIAKRLNLDTSSLESTDVYDQLKQHMSEDYAKIFDICKDTQTDIIYVANEPRAVLYSRNTRNLSTYLGFKNGPPESEEDLFNFIDNLFNKSSQTTFQELQLTNTWDNRERLALNIRPFDFDHFDFKFDYQHPHYWINCLDLWTRTETVIEKVMVYLDLEIDKHRFDAWLPICKVWQKKQLDLLDFCYNQPHIVEAIVNNLYYEIDLTFDQEIVIQHCLIYQHGLNLKTWQLKKFPNNTQDLHKLLEPNIHSVENIYNI